MRTQHDAQMVAAKWSSPRGGTPPGTPALQAPRGVALILVMLAMLMLSVLAATIVFTARAETFASTNYRLDTQADYLAKAGIQRAINWFRSTHYQPVSQTQANTYYNVSSTGAPFNLWISNTSPVKTCASPPCLAFNQTVQLIGFGSGSSQYPNIDNSEATPRKVAAAFASDLNDSTFTNNRITGDPVEGTNSGYYLVRATLLNYETVNALYKPPAIAPSYCVATTVPYTYTCPMETWQIESKAIWTGTSSSTSRAATAEEVAIIQPVYWPTWGNALYGFCSVSMQGSAGTCTDAFNSSLGAYGGSPPNPSIASGLCGTTAPNVISTGAGVGSNGGVVLGSNVTVGGDVTIGNSPSPGCAATSGCTLQGGGDCTTDQVLGQVVNGPHVDPPPMPTFPDLSGATSYSLTGGNPIQTIPDSVPKWTGTNPGPPPTPQVGGPPPWYTPPPSGNPPLALAQSGTCATSTCDGTEAHPYLIKDITMTATGSQLELVGGLDALHPVYYDMECLTETGGNVYISGYVVLNIQGTSSCGLSLKGNGISNGIASSVPPDQLVINYAGTNPVAVGGNAAVSGLLNAPNADVTLGGGGNLGYWVGAIQAQNVTLQGGYPIHYDVNLGRVGGNLGIMISTAYGRKKM